MTWVAVAVAGGAIVGGALQSDASKSAANTQAQALDKSTQGQQQMFATTNNQQAPYRQAGYNALSLIAQGQGVAPPQTGSAGQQVDWNKYLQDNPDVAASGMDAQTHYNQYGKNEGRKVSMLAQPDQSAMLASSGITPGQFTHQFDANDLKSGLAPNYDFMLSQGQGATKNMANLGGGVFSGNTLKAINDYTQNYAGGAYQQAFENYNTNQTNIYNRLANIAGLGQVAGSNSTTGGSQYASGIAGSTAAAGAARAGGQIGSANALAQGGNNAMGWYAAGNYLNNQQQSPANNNTQWIEKPQ